ncbi:MAG: endonuclease III domain-containing protein, partial [Promethearchaeota archaeon]
MSEKKNNRIYKQKNIDLMVVYERLIQKYGPQGWWPLISCQDWDENPTKRGQVRGYHPQNYELPIKTEDIYEVMFGAILTQNTTWPNAERAVLALREADLIDPMKIIQIDNEKLAEVIKPSGYYNQKAIKLKNLCKFLTQNPISSLKKMDLYRLREKLLAIKGVGEETADSIILYALKRPSFVIDSYTRRLLGRLGITPKQILEYVSEQSFEKAEKILGNDLRKLKYDFIQKFFQEN